MLRLFPLQRVVLFPGMSLPLVVFEPRYRQLVAECVEHGEPFGVNLIRSGPEVGGSAEPHAVGTTARIRSIAALPDGRLRLDAVGERRFRIRTLQHDQPYLAAEVEYLADEAEREAPPDLEAAVFEHIAILRRLRMVPHGEYARAPARPRSRSALADAGAAECGAPPDALQAVLETLHVPRRLEAVLALLEEPLRLAYRQAQLAAAVRWGSTSARN